MFCAVSLAIVWGTTLERIKFGVYILYAIVFSAVIYPIGSHWVFGGGWLQSNLGMQDFAGSTAVHLIGATGGLAALLHLGARRGKYGPDGKPRAIPGHNMPLFGLGIFILWLGWFGFNPGSTLGAGDGRFAQIIARHQPRRRGRRPRRRSASRSCKTGTLDIGMAGNGAIAALVAITAPSGYVERVGGADHRPRRRPHRPAVHLRDRQEDRRPGGRAVGTRHRGHLGHALLRPVHRSRAREVQRGRRRRPLLHAARSSSSASRRSAW